MDDDDDVCVIIVYQPLTLQLLGCESSELLMALTNRTIEARGDVVTSPLNPEQVRACVCIGKVALQ